MRASGKLFQAGLWSAVAVVSIGGLSAAQTPASVATSSINIKSFGCVNPQYYRGGQPDDRDYVDLSALGIKTVVDLERGGSDNEESRVESNGMKFYRIGLSDRAWPTGEQTEEFLKIVNDPANQPVFVHCHGGRHRTGAMTAVYRMKHDGWTADRAYQEMKQYKFESGLGHGSLKDYVYDYYSHMGRGTVAADSPK